jgi:hypothetical protein
MRTLIAIPHMYTAAEVTTQLDALPSDFNDVSAEFWRYIDAKLTPLLGRIRISFSATPSTPGGVQEAVITRIVARGGTVCVIEDAPLASEVAAWRAMAEATHDPAALDLYREALQDLDRQLSTAVDAALPDGALGVLFLGALGRLSLPADVRVVTMTPFNPADYLQRHRVVTRG